MKNNIFEGVSPIKKKLMIFHCHVGFSGLQLINFQVMCDIKKPMSSRFVLMCRASSIWSKQKPWASSLCWMRNVACPRPRERMGAQQSTARAKFSPQTLGVLAHRNWEWFHGTKWPMRFGRWGGTPFAHHLRIWLDSWGKVSFLG